MDINDKAAGLAGLGGSVEVRKAVAAHFYTDHPETAIAIDDGSYAIAVISSRFRVPPATAFEVCRLAGLGVR
ncbi:hypothetical protein EN780_03000 [Mesorhizobium sp. M4B.F.Ca.ET.089.01.1.1]|uniref:hypothetical protein n=1 Tax=Mesorhizobium sp. M4B.F.Ca.ET.089.01.1.1 TaxID=2496662 RepID=UPI000FE2B2A7|nr:hypothetical protein [Mesorhizobium sp. M4B.F.Ca.ET.089.01.1.1]RWX70504.1 hypothetical protein EN780_03000 [Mesorhizobium sp. M4B.F.Ca.ET.089.01.1.1]